MGLERHTGKLKDWDPAKACGWITSAELPGRRLFAHKSEFTEQFADGGEPPIGSTMSFVVGVDPKSGKERAQAIHVERFAASLPRHSAPTLAAQQIFRSLTQAPIRLAGTLGEWNPSHACGWIDLRDLPGKRLFAHKSEFAVPFEDNQVPPLGTRVSCALGIDPKSGKERAQDIRVERVSLGGARNRRQGHLAGLGASLGGAMNLGQLGLGLGLGLGGLGGSAVAPQQQQLPQQKIHSPLGPPRMFGIIKEWSPAQACGWIEIKDFPSKRLFAHKSEFAHAWDDGNEPPLGTPVSFIHGIDSKSGKERAQDIFLEVDGQGHPSCARTPGTIVGWNAQKACGWIECRNYPGVRLFAHKSEFVDKFSDGEEPPVGTQVTFVRGVDPKSGKERAQAIHITQGGESFEDNSRPTMIGHLTAWDSTKACGWIECETLPGTRLFAHKSEFVEQFEDGVGEPATGSVVTFVAGVDQRSGKHRALNIQVEFAEPAAKRSRSGDGP